MESKNQSCVFESDSFFCNDIFEIDFDFNFQVVIVVAIILYYERASQKKAGLQEAGEDDEFISAETKKEES